MKRPHSKIAPTRGFRSIKEDVSTDQLAGIGAIVLIYNYAESAINRMLPVALGLSSGVYLSVTTRINGIDGKIEILKLAAADIGLPQDMRDFLADSLGNSGFSLFKKFRDAIIHARIHDPALGYGEVIESRGKMSQVLLTAEALTILFDHIEALKDELFSFLLIFVAAREINNRASDGPETEQLALRIRDGFAQAQRHRTRRLSLPPLPEFPEESPPLGEDSQD
jgi:hypothetical protein